MDNQHIIEKIIQLKNRVRIMHPDTDFAKYNKIIFNLAEDPLKKLKKRQANVFNEIDRILKTHNI